MPGKKYLRRDVADGLDLEVTTPTTSADTPAAGDIPALGTGGRMDNTLLNAAGTSPGTAGTLPYTDATGRIDQSFMPAGVVPEVATAAATEALAAGNYVNLYSSTGLKVRKADASTTGKEANGVVLAAVANGGTATVYIEGINTQLSGLTPGLPVWLDPTTPGGVTQTYPTFTAGQTSQRVGKALSATSASLKFDDPIKTG